MVKYTNLSYSYVFNLITARRQQQLYPLAAVRAVLWLELTLPLLPLEVLKELPETPRSASYQEKMQQVQLALLDGPVQRFRPHPVPSQLLAKFGRG